MIQVLVVEEVRAIGETLAEVLQSKDDLEVVGCATDLNEAMPHLGQCDVAVVNASLTTDSSTRLVSGLRRLAPRVKVLVMGLAHSQHAVWQCLESGVAGYVMKDSPLDDLLVSLRAVSQNEAPITPPLANSLVTFMAEMAGFDDREVSELCWRRNLTRREREVLNLVQQGLTNQEIASALVIEQGTVKNHVHNILRKLNVNSRHDAANVSRLAGLRAFGDSAAQLFREASSRRTDVDPEGASLLSLPVSQAN